jgi:hypothetical protein
VSSLVETAEKRWPLKRSAEPASCAEQQQPATKIIKLEADVSRQISAYGASRCDFPLAHCDNLTDEIFAESDDSFSYCSAAADDHRGKNGSLVVDVVSGSELADRSGAISGHLLASLDQSAGVESQEEEEAAAAGRTTKSQQFPSKGEKSKKGRGARASSQPSLTTPLPGTGTVVY